MKTKVYSTKTSKRVWMKLQEKMCFASVLILTKYQKCIKIIVIVLKRGQVVKVGIKKKKKIFEIIKIILIIIYLMPLT